MDAILGTIFLFGITFSLMFLQVDFTAMATALAILHYGLFPGIFVGIIAKIAASLIRAHFDHRTIVHVIGLCAVIVACMIFRKGDDFIYPAIMFFIYTLITFPLVQFLGGNMFKGALFTLKDFIAGIALLQVINLMHIL